MPLIWAGVDYYFDADGEVIENAVEYGLFTGELGAAVDIGFTQWGMRPEVLLGYYKFNFWDIPNTAYFMMHGGIEFYRKINSNYRVAWGFGYFYSIIYDEILGYSVSRSVYYPGSSSWLGFSYEEPGWELNFRLRWHHFFSYRAIQRPLSDMVFVCRYILPF